MNTIFQAALIAAACLAGFVPAAQAQPNQASETTLFAPSTAAPPAYVCPMDHASTSHKPGFCRECGMAMVDKSSQLRIAVLVFDGVEDIDFAGPMEVFGQTGAIQFTVGPSTAAVRTVAGLKLQPDHDFAHAPPADVLLIPGGAIGAVSENPKLLAWIRERSAESRAVLSVCTGAFILGKAGLLDGHRATTIAGMIPELARRHPKATIVRDLRYVDNGVIITTGGLSAGIDGALHLVDRELGRLTAERTARDLEYVWNSDPHSEFGNSARLRFPDITEILPVESFWDQQQDSGNSDRWQLAGALEFPMSAAEFLAGTTERIGKDGWKVDSSAPLERSFVMQEADGQTWIFRVALVAEPAPGSYRLTMTMDRKA